jgi:probable phosphoglycerate mutase
MADALLLARHGETEWSLSGQHTGSTDIALTEVGRNQARRIGDALAGRTFALVLTSPLGRARETCELAGFAGAAEVRDELREWDYGDYEGQTTAAIRRKSPGWTVWDHGGPNGEQAADVGARVDALLADLEPVDGDVLVFAHGHLLPVLAARWVDLPPEAGRSFELDTATISRLGYHHQQPVVSLWNDAHHL